MTFPQRLTDAPEFVIAHRGASGRHLENSMAAFNAVASAGIDQADGVEFDIHSTADGAFVVHHDPVLANGTVIAETALADLQQFPLPNGEPMPVLGDVVAALAGVDLFIELKGVDRAFEAALVQQLTDTATPDHWHLHSFDHAQILRLHDLDPTLSLGILATDPLLDTIGMVLHAGAHTLWQGHEVINQELVETCERNGIALVAWTVNTRAEAKRLRATGVRALCGNWPDRLRAE